MWYFDLLRGNFLTGFFFFFKDADCQFNNSFTSAPKFGNHGDSNRENISVFDDDIKVESEECEVSGLINSDGEEHNWKPVIKGKCKITTRIDNHIFKLVQYL